ncbi:EMAP-2 / tRNA binding domain containing protein [Leishmania donovani]|uniref:Putative_tRNA_binding_domain_containing_protein_p utative/Pfam:PF01588 n=1 Tax=Leishmania donovani TaxID=5661 RepID=A0A6J8FE28_LEIDO|nr:EMAP-2 / tRNA binding domain containing protein [Leishmania donovani]VDZ44625.1 Putative_tRNA_binding_domain_containing_protein_putative/Pfam:PF01588 [Leishmania donovani]
MQFVINSSSILAPALQHALESVLSVPALCIEMCAEGPHRVTVDGKTFRGLQPFLQALRRTAVTPEQKAFLGEDEEQVSLVNQWVGAAAVLDADVARAVAEPATSVAKALYSDVERILVATSNAASHYLTGSERATMADVLLYAAAFNHSAHTEVLPTTMKWAVHAQQDAYLAPIRSSAVKTAENHSAGKAHGATRAEVSYVKPSEEEILRRRAEKEKAKAEKAAAVAAAKASASPSARAPEGKKATKTQLDSTSLCVRVGQLTNLRRHPGADRLYVEDMVLGDETRTIVSGLVGNYVIEELEGTQCLVVCNMKPKSLMGVTSQGMVLCAKRDAEVKLIRPPACAKPGDRILFGASYDAAVAAAAASEPISGNKMTEVLSHLHTNADGVLCWKEEPARHPSGAAVAIADMANCPVS